MYDKCNRKIEYLRLSITDLCNFRCKYCMPSAGVVKCSHDDILSIEELVKIAQASVACGITKIRITGGEPLVRKGVIDICKKIASIKELKELCFTTNGSLLEENAYKLKNAGVDRLNISIDTLNAEKFMSITRGGNIDTVFKGIRAAEKAGFSKLKLNVVLIGGFNDDEIPDFVNLTRENNWEIRFIELMPIGECSNWGRGNFIPLSRVLEACPELEQIKSDGVARRFHVLGYAGNVGLISPMSHKFCSQCNRVRVTADGKFKPCLHSDMELSLRGYNGVQLVRRIQQGIMLKPESHTMIEDGTSAAKRTMNGIGG